MSLELFSLAAGSWMKQRGPTKPIFTMLSVMVHACNYITINLSEGNWKIRKKSYYTGTDLIIWTWIWMWGREQYVCPLWMCVDFYCAARVAASALLLLIHGVKCPKRPLSSVRLSPRGLCDFFITVCCVHKQLIRIICYFDKCVVKMKLPNQ